MWQRFQLRATLGRENMPARKQKTSPRLLSFLVLSVFALGLAPDVAHATTRGAVDLPEQASGSASQGRGAEHGGGRAHATEVPELGAAGAGAAAIVLLGVAALLFERRRRPA